MPVLRYWDVAASAYLPVAQGPVGPAGPAGGFGVPPQTPPSGGFGSITDAAGNVWVAKPGVNGGAWKQARDVLFSHAYRNAAFSITNSAAWLPTDTVQDDAYGMFAGGGWMNIPLAGLYQVYAQVGCSGPASWLQLTLYKGASTQIAANLFGNTGGVTAYISSITTWRFNTGDQFNAQVVASNTMPAGVGNPGVTYNQIRYVGSG